MCCNLCVAIVSSMVLFIMTTSRTHNRETSPWRPSYVRSWRKQMCCGWRSCAAQVRSRTSSCISPLLRPPIPRISSLPPSLRRSSSAFVSTIRLCLICWFHFFHLPPYHAVFHAVAPFVNANIEFPVQNETHIKMLMSTGMYNPINLLGRLQQYDITIIRWYYKVNNSWINIK